MLIQYGGPVQTAGLHDPHWVLGTDKFNRYKLCGMVQLFSIFEIFLRRTTSPSPRDIQTQHQLSPTREFGLSVGNIDEGVTNGHLQRWNLTTLNLSTVELNRPSDTETLIEGYQYTPSRYANEGCP